MAKYYTEEASKEASMKTKPSQKTIKSILDFSKALNIVNYKGLQFESIQN